MICSLRDALSASISSVDYLSGLVPRFMMTYCLLSWHRYGHLTMLGRHERLPDSQDLYIVQGGIVKVGIELAATWYLSVNHTICYAVKFAADLHLSRLCCCADEQT